MIEILGNSIKNENKGIISLNNLFNTDVLFNSLNNNNNSISNSNYNLSKDISVHRLEYIINFFNEKIIIFYIFIFFY